MLRASRMLGVWSSRRCCSCAVIFLRKSSSLACKVFTCRSNKCSCSSKLELRASDSPSLRCKPSTSIRSNASTSFRNRAFSSSHLERRSFVLSNSPESCSENWSTRMERFLSLARAFWRLRMILSDIFSWPSSVLCLTFGGGAAAGALHSSSPFAPKTFPSTSRLSSRSPCWVSFLMEGRNEVTELITFEAFRTKPGFSGEGRPSSMSDIAFSYEAPRSATLVRRSDRPAPAPFSPPPAPAADDADSASPGVMSKFSMPLRPSRLAALASLRSMRLDDPVAALHFMSAS
mmetsp:Transcript_3012/g.7286  ORF Transcript_3012/g.7286 Transcript_3012/m.7286 type:complete len:289 (-) Transcript_3012:136-1002(-)